MYQTSVAAGAFEITDISPFGTGGGPGCDHP
ncbi:TPA: hypothetical protein JAN03_15050 [Citrobacter freundii]|nr:hypothetical protein [Citrobacter freundii]